MVTDQRKGFGSKDFSEKKISDSNPSAHTYLRMEEESKCPKFKSLISVKAGPHPDIPSQPNLQDIDCLCYTISIIMVPGFKRCHSQI